MGIVIDSSVLIAAERGKFDFDAFVLRFADEPMHLSAITASELLHGVYRAVTDQHRERRRAFVESAIIRFPVLPADLDVARAHAECSAILGKAGRTIGAHDLWIGATAIARGFKLVSRDAPELPVHSRVVI